MVEIRVAGVDATRNEVHVRSEWESRSVVRVVDTVEAWPASYGVGSATLSIGDAGGRAE